MKEGRRSLSLAVLPNTRNRLRLEPRVVACWAVGDGVFDFGHKFVGKDAKPDFQRFNAIRKQHPHAQIALFGHTDAVGSETYNHQLGYERAMAVFAVLKHDPDLWYDLFRNDRDGLRLLKAELEAEGETIKDAPGAFGASTLEAVRAHFTRIGPPDPVPNHDFLSAGQAAVQSCAEFNPVLVPAPWMFEVLQEQEHRVALQAVNRRVVALFFDPATVTHFTWPCPPGGGGPTKCKARFWKASRAAIRTTDDGLQWWPRAFRGNPKLPWIASEQVFACRFHQRLVHERRCEQVDPYAVIPKEELEPPEKPEVPPPPPPNKRRHKIPTFPPTPTPPDVLPEVIVNCEHPFRFNKHTLAEESGEMKGEDAFAVVPPAEGDTIFMRIFPDSEREHVRLYWDDTLLPVADEMVLFNRSGFGTKQVDHIDADVENPLWLYTKEEILRRTVRIKVEGRENDRWVIPIRIYPRDSAEWEGLKMLNKARGWLGDWIEELEEKLKMLIDDFEFKFLPEDGCEVGAQFQWRELPLLAEGVTPVPDHRVMFWWRFVFVFDPFVSLRGTLKVSYFKALNTFRKWAKGTWAEKTIEKFFDVIPQEIFDALEAARLEVSPTVSGGVNAAWARRSPDERLDIGPHEDGAAKEVEGRTKTSLKAAGILDTATALLMIGSKVTVKLSFGLGAEYRYGLIASLEKGKEKLGMYLQASTTGLKAKLFMDLELPFYDPDPIKPSFVAFEKRKSDLVRWIWWDGEDAE
ncbi:MAG: OmpA family protein [Nannocystaceae bacterium]|nr:OmpA family protein [bacterium]